MAVWVIVAVFCSLLPLNYGDSLPEVSENDVYAEGALYNRTFKSTSKDWNDPVIKCGLKRNITYNVTITWIPPSHVDNTEDTKIETLTVDKPPSSTVKFTKVGIHAVGVWTCVISDSDNKHNISREVFLSSYPYIKGMPRSINLVEGESLELQCEVWGYPEPKISWRQYPEDGSIDDAHDLDLTGPRIRVDNSTTSNISKLHIADTVLADRKYYMCVATSQPDGAELEAYFATLVRVKSHLAPLWPFLGILAEIIVLAAIIGGYELYRRRQKTDGDGDTTQIPEDARKKK